jgi:transcriptional regulator with XRE-family HTH domain
MDDEKDVLAWGQTVEQLRSLRGWKQERLAVEARISKSSLSDYERGKLDPSEAVRSRVEEALGGGEWFDVARSILGWILQGMEDGRSAAGLESFFEEAAAQMGESTTVVLRAGLASLRRKRN